MTRFVDPADIRLAFSEAMSAMYRAEVPLYGTLLEIVATSNARVLQDNPALNERLAAQGELDRLGVERHGAIRVGTPEELHLMRRLFAVMGMVPVGYYDLGVAGLPVHSTAFRPIDTASLNRCAFRIFCSLLRLELIEDVALREQAQALLARRSIVTDGALALIDRFEREGGLGTEEAEAFVLEALETFRWHGEALVDHATYEAFSRAHRLIADIVCFRGPHINHLTPRALDIDAVQAEMIARGIKAKAVIEGPPRRSVPILLRQTSFQALEEAILFRDGDESVAGVHTARFGEIEQRGIALTPHGRALYDAILAEAEQARGLGGKGYEAHLAEIFQRFPDDLDAIREQGLAYFTYTPTPKAAMLSAGRQLPSGAPDELVADGWLEASPITYEDFLPVSAAGIFRSNLADAEAGSRAGASSQDEFEAALGVPCLDPFGLYLDQEQASLDMLG
ncbi:MULTISPECIES: VOC family protein [unclassified Sphingobium]|uniref:2-oxoadipate dioxygenase/decarboxylase HglS n=1 Tax=unclassified Sphingobium TaxID=2611147 RepID=UPI0022254763|nr:MULTISPECIES: VOC family protein [unclassified Sphingobium]MCW2412525.1 putative glyoxalase superfamily metalloenzyme YdcJ [Sphingobium sp. B8D3D]MCW2415178.1 putative glyoxalase superfamily metalloenzyme YdcJ [Sphingobium sp. B8D3A]